MLVLKKNNLIIIAICILFLLAAIVPGQVPMLGIMFFLFVVFLSIALEDRKHLFFPKLVIILLLFQNTIIGIGSHYGFSDLSQISYLTQIPTICIFISGILILLRKKIDRVDILALLMFGLLSIFWFIGAGTLISKLIYARNYTCFYMAYLLGKENIIRKSDLDEMIRFYISLSVIAAIFGILSMMLGQSFYFAIGMREVALAKNAVTFWNNGMPGYFITKVFGRLVYRLGSFYYEPVNFSYFISLGSILAFNSYQYKKTWKNLIKLSIILVGNLLTFGKGGIVIMLMGLCLVSSEKWIRRIRNTFGRNRTRSIFLFLLVIIIIFGILFTNEFVINQFGSVAHYQGIYNGVKYMIEKPWGYGLGSSGNIESAISGQANDVGESGLFVMGYQIGVQGIALLILSMFAISKEVNHNINNDRSICRLYTLFTYIPIILFFFFALQENTFTPQCITGYMLFAGGLCNKLE